MSKRWGLHQRKRRRKWIFSWRLIFVLPFLTIFTLWFISIGTRNEPPLGLVAGQSRILFADEAICFQKVTFSSLGYVPIPGMPASMHFPIYGEAAFGSTGGGSYLLGMIRQDGTGYWNNNVSIAYQEIRVKYDPMFFYSLLGVGIWLVLLRRCVNRINWESKGICYQCGYDLRASTERCPECGQAIVEAVAVEETQTSQAMDSRKVQLTSDERQQEIQARKRYMRWGRWMNWAPLLIILLIWIVTQGSAYTGPVGWSAGSFRLESAEGYLCLQHVYKVVPNPRFLTLPAGTNPNTPRGGGYGGNSHIFFEKRWGTLSTASADTHYWEFRFKYGVLIFLSFVLGFVLQVRGTLKYQMDD